MSEKPIKSVRGTSPMTTQQPADMHGAKAWTIGVNNMPVVNDRLIFCPPYRFVFLFVTTFKEKLNV